MTRMTPAPKQPPSPTLGFVTVTRGDRHEFFGGMLVVNALGRPLEFHCTEPVIPNRAQQILYGTTLESYLAGDLMAPALIAQAKHSPSIVFTDRDAVMAARPQMNVGLVLLVDRSAEQAPTEDDRQLPPVRLAAGAGDQHVDQDVDRHADQARVMARRGVVTLWRWTRPPYQLAVAATHREDADRLDELWNDVAGQLELDEPFARIREAIDEARGVAHKSA